MWEHATLFLTKDLLEFAPDKWNETAIAARAQRLYRAAVKVWPDADGI